ncbi:MAG: hypothetical protein L3J71_13890 [Victivallaceae bacterium]|nr:hypothetical protein [Victivallaceae bacterium]
MIELKNISLLLRQKRPLIIFIVFIVCIITAKQLYATEPTTVKPYNSFGEKTRKKTDLKIYTRFDLEGNKYDQPRPKKKLYPFGIKFNEARPPQYIYLVPAHLGGTIFTAIGAFVVWPFSATYNYFHQKDSRWDLVPPVPWASQTIGLGGAYLLGSPFWCLEQAFWEFPVWMFSDGDNAEVQEKTNNTGYRIGTGI